MSFSLAQSFSGLKVSICLDRIEKLSQMLSLVIEYLATLDSQVI